MKKTAFWARKSVSARPPAACARGSDLRLPRGGLRNRGRLPTRAGSCRPAATAVRELGSNPTGELYVPPEACVNDANRVIRPGRPRGPRERRCDLPCPSRRSAPPAPRTQAPPAGPAGQPTDSRGGGPSMITPNDRPDRPVADVPRAVAAGSSGCRRSDPAPGTAGAASSAAGATRCHCRFPARVDTLCRRFRFLPSSLRAETRAAQPATSPGIQSTFVDV